MTLTKAKLKIVPVVFFLFAILGALIVFAGFFGDRFAASFAQYLPVQMDCMPFGFVGSALIVVDCMMPILFYFFCLLQFLFLDVLRLAVRQGEVPEELSPAARAGSVQAAARAGAPRA